MNPLVSNLRPTASSSGSQARARLELFDLWQRLDAPTFRSGLNRSDHDYLHSLRAELDPELLLEDLLSWGRRLEAQGREVEALELYHSLLAVLPAEVPGRDRALGRSEALQGRGSVDARLEVSARNFLVQASDPAMIFGFLSAGAAASLVRGFALRSLAFSAETGWTRGWRARALAGGAAYAAEVPTFVLGTRTAHGLLGYEQGFGEASTLVHDLGGAALFLGSLKLSGLAANRLAGDSSFRPIALGAGTLTGIYLGHRAEESFGFRPSQEETHRWFDACETFLQLRVGGRIASALIGSGGAGLSEAELQASRGVAETPGWRFLSSAAVRPMELAANLRPDEEITQPIFRREVDAALSRINLEYSLGPRASSLVVQSLEGIGRQTGLGEALLRLVRGSRYEEVANFELAIRRLHYATTYASPRGLSGSYLSTVARAGMEAAVRHQDQARFDRLLQYVAEGASVDQMETLLAELDPQLRLLPERLIERSLRLVELASARSESQRLIRRLPLPREARQSLQAFDRFVAEADRVQVVNYVGDWLEKYPEQRELVGAALVRARLNPAGALRTQRLIRVLMYEPSHLAKLRELIDMDLGVRVRDQFHPFRESDAILGSQDDGYVAEPDLARELSQLYRRLPDLLEAESAAGRKARTRRILEEVWPDNRRPLDLENVRRALSLLGDPISETIERDLADERLRLVFLPREEFSVLFAGIDSGEPRRSFGGLFRPAAQDPSGRDSIYLLRVEAASHSAYRDLAFLRLVQLVHEHAHFVRAPLQTNRGLRGTYLEEMLAEARAFRWQAEQGDIRLLQQYLTVHPAGLGLYFRDWVNFTYFLNPNG